MIDSILLKLSDSSSDPAGGQPLNIATDGSASYKSPPHLFNQDDNFVLDPQTISSGISRMFKHLSGQLIDQQAVQSSELLNRVSSQHREVIYEQKARMDSILDEHTDRIGRTLSELDERIGCTHATLQSVVDDIEVQRRQTIALHKRLDDIVNTNSRVICTDSTSSNFFSEIRNSSEELVRPDMRESMRRVTWESNTDDRHPFDRGGRADCPDSVSDQTYSQFNSDLGAHDASKQNECPLSDLKPNAPLDVGHNLSSNLVHMTDQGLSRRTSPNSN